MENLDLQETALPKSLQRWTDYHLAETYNYTKRHDLKVYIASEFWWRSEMLEFHHNRENTYQIDANNLEN